MPGTVPATIIPTLVWKVLHGGTGTPQGRRFQEKASQTFKVGTPVVVENTGYLIASPTLSTALTIAGISQEPAANLSSSGVAQVLTQGSVQNQISAKIIPGGVAPNDGRCGVWIADENTYFISPCDLAHTPAITDLGLIYGYSKDSTSGLWFIDTTITAAGSGAILEIVEIPVISGNVLAPSTPIAGGLMVFRVTRAGQQMSI